MSVFVLMGCQSQDKSVQLEVKEVTIEYGEEVSQNIINYLDVDQLSESKQADISKSAKISIQDLQLEDGKLYPKIETYDVLIEYQNSQYKTKLIVADTTPPVFDNVDKVEVLKGNNNYDFLQDIKASDLQDVTYDFITSKINFDKTGTYTMEVNAKDTSGNISFKSIQVIIKEEKTSLTQNSKKGTYDGTTGQQQLDNLCDQILDTIIQENMSDKQKAYAVYQWVEGHIRYSGSMNVTDWRSGALTSLKYRKGNCLAFCYSSEALLTRLGFENIEVHDRELTHYWNMVKVNNGWYHFDTTSGWGQQRFLWTNQQLSSYRYDSPILNQQIDYDWDMSDYPTTP